MLMLILILVALVAFYKYGTRNFDYFRSKGVPFNKPLFFVGSRLGMVFKTSNITEFVNSIYNEFRNEKVSGMFEFNHPAFFIRDPELIKQLAVKEFDSFTDHRIILSEDAEPLFASSLFSLTGQKWRDMRATLSPAFTGSKMRLMFNLMNEVGSKMSKSVRDQITKGDNNKIEFKEFSRKFTIDIIGTCAFGIEVNSFDNPNNDFIRIATKATNFNTVAMTLKVIAFFALPKLMKMTNIKFLDSDLYDFFNNVITDTINTREKQGISRNDMIDLLLQAKHGKLSHENEAESTDGFAAVEESNLGKQRTKREWTNNDLLAQCFIFFFAGFETVSSVMTFMAYELVLNPDVQKKLQDEVDKTDKELNGGALTYDDVTKLKYMDMVLCETLRKWPAAPMTDRMCTKDFLLEYDNKKILIEAGRNFMIPIYSLHHDEKYFPNPERFDPERFSDENKHNIRQDCYMPFGIGPRNCIGNRFALLEIKTIFYYLLLNFTLEATSETQIPIKLANNQAAFQLEKGLNCALVPRTK